jgi:FtsP/CotA-like multicopper oxidase with cupredoxin domain
MTRLHLVAVAGVLALTSVPSALPQYRELDARAPDERIISNDNRSPAGTMRHDTLVLQLELRRGLWFPGADSGSSQIVQAFAEVGMPLQIPGPMLRVVTGTPVHVSVRNTLTDSTLIIWGLEQQPGAADDTVQVKPGAVREVRFVVGAPGTYFYWGSTTGKGMEQRDGEDSQLYGALIVDSVSTTGPPRDRVFILGAWHEEPDTTRPKPWIPRDMMVINGKTWPYTERFSFAVGDTVHWRWLNPTVDAHPMHLHGFYFSVDSRGAWAADTILAPADRRMVVTEMMPPGGTMAMSWAPTRPGNWLFHCHFGFHVSHYLSFHRITDDKDPDSPAYVNHTAQGMAGLVLGIQVHGAANHVASHSRAPRQIRLFLQAKPVPGKPPLHTYAFVIQHGAAVPAADSVPGESAGLVLRRGEPVRITMLNRLPYPSAVHWHGIEVESSYVDGVPGWSGTTRRLAPAVMPGDSFTVEFTPPRAGTFIYHSHSNEYFQVAAGLAAPLIVLDSAERYDPATDHAILINQGLEGTGRINGRAVPDTLHLVAGVTNRFRIINIAPDWRVLVTLGDSTGTTTWRAIAKDGADLPLHQATSRPARLLMGPGETADFAFTARRPGALTLEVATQKTGWEVRTPIIVTDTIR